MYFLNVDGVFSDKQVACRSKTFLTNASIPCIKINLTEILLKKDYFVQKNSSWKLDFQLEIKHIKIIGHQISKITRILGMLFFDLYPIKISNKGIIQ